MQKYIHVRTANCIEINSVDQSCGRSFFQVNGSILQEKAADSAGADPVVHSTCKLLGHSGTQPEYERGVQAFPEHLQSLLENVESVGDTEEEELEQLRASLTVTLGRQVGRRYIVTSRNAGRMFFLAPYYAVIYIRALELTKKLNNIEKDVLTYMTCPQDLALLICG